MEYRSLLKTVFHDGKVSHFDAAVAYATYGGAECLIQLLRGTSGDEWANIEKRWLVGIDWMRSEPRALDLLAQLDKSEVRVHDGKFVVSRLGCTPRLPYHPKTFILKGKNRSAVVIGSGNLSKNGLLHGHEVGIALTVGSASDSGEKAANLQVSALQTWFTGLWDKASPWKSVRSAYLAVYATKANFSALTPTDDDSADSDTLALQGARSRTFTPEQLRQLRAAENFWIQGGVLTKNRGPSLPGTQLMMRRFSRVFFGIRARDVPRNTSVGSVAVKYGSYLRDDCPIRFSDNSMDVITLPVPGHGGPPTYDNQILHFERADDGIYLLKVHPESSLSTFRKRSDALGSAFKMSSGRGFGVY